MPRDRKLVFSKGGRRAPGFTTGDIFSFSSFLDSENEILLKFLGRERGE